MTIVQPNEYNTTQKFATLKEYERLHPALQGDPGLVVAVMDLRLCGFFDGRQWPMPVPSISYLSRYMSEVCGGAERCHRERLQKLKKLGVFSLVDGRVSIDLSFTVSKDDGVASNVDVEGYGVASESDVVASYFDAPTRLDVHKTAGQGTEIGGTNTKTNTKEYEDENAADAAGAGEGIEGVKMATLGADPEGGTRFSGGKPWRSKAKPSEPVKREPRITDSPGYCHRCGKHLYPGHGELDGKNADGYWQIRCRIPCEDIAGKKAAVMKLASQRQALVSEAAQAAPDDEHKNCLLDLQSHIVLQHHRFSSPKEMIEDRRAFFTRIYGADEFDWAVETIRGIYKETTK